MADRSKTVGFSVSPREKEAIRQAAAREGVSMSAFVRRRALDSITPEEPDLAPGAEYDPLSDFITARLHVDADADPLPKHDLYRAYTAFCEEHYPDHDIETQHKLSREVGALDGVTTGRAYIKRNGERQHKRCFHGVRWSNPVENEN